MRHVLFCLMVLSMGQTAYAQEDVTVEMNYGSIVTQSAPSPEMEIEIVRYIERSGRNYSERYARMVAPRICRQRDFLIPEDTPHPRAGLILRIESGECLTGRPYFVHNPDNAVRRIWPINEEEAIAILQSIPPITVASAPQ